MGNIVHKMPTEGGSSLMYLMILNLHHKSLLTHYPCRCHNFQMGGLCSVLVSCVRLPCCGASPELLKVIPSTVTCSWCAAPVSYSWCSHYVHLQTLCPRSHCMECFRCKPIMNTHCQVGGSLLNQATFLQHVWQCVS